MIYRLSADRNPLHIDPEVAKAAGYPQPILHGLGTFGVVGHALLRSVCDYDPARVRSFAGRFSAPVFPGETIRTEILARRRRGELPRAGAGAQRRGDEQRPRRGRDDRVTRQRPSSRRSARRCARCAPDSPANTGASSTASAPIRPSSSQALTKAGFLAALIPEEYGGSGLTMSAAAAIMEEIHASGCNGAACHAQMYTMGTVLRHGSAEQKQKISAGHRQRRAAAAGVRRHRADLRHRHAQPAHHRGARGQQRLRHQRPENLDLARRAFRPDAAAGAHHAARAGRRSAPKGSRCSWSTCARRRTRASPSGRSAP